MFSISCRMLLAECNRPVRSCFERDTGDLKAHLSVISKKNVTIMNVTHQICVAVSSLHSTHINATHSISPAVVAHVARALCC